MLTDFDDAQTTAVTAALIADVGDALALYADSTGINFPKRSTLSARK
jgi:hypothetical protein